MKAMVVHCKKAPHDVYIGRPSVWGNPFSHLENSQAEFRVATRTEAISRYEQWFRAQPELVARAKRELRGKVLGCWCKPLHCHGDVLARIANEEPDGEQETIEKARQAAELLRAMQVTSQTFYRSAVCTGDHRLVEFNGLITKYIELLATLAQRAGDLQGRLPMKDHDAAYLAEKLSCIYGREFLEEEKVRDEFIKVLFDGQFKLVPSH